MFVLFASLFVTAARAALLDITPVPLFNTDTLSGGASPVAMSGVTMTCNFECSRFLDPDEYICAREEVFNSCKDDFTMVFTRPVTNFRVNATVVGPNDLVTITAFDNSDTLLTTVVVVADGGYDFSAFGAIKRLVFDDASDNNGGVGWFNWNFDLPSTGGANGDPHLVGANGAKFDFNGQPNGEYALFSAPQLQVNVHLAADGPTDRFMTKVGVVFRNVTMQFGIYRLNQAFFDRLNQQLAPFGAKASYNGWQIRLQLCPGEEVVIAQHHANKVARPTLVHDDGSTFFYLDVQITTPHCNDAYGGALGQTYQCAYVEGRQKFTFDHASEESFRVKSLHAVDASDFDVDAPCSAPKQSDAKVMTGGASH